ncbi:MAG: flagellar brake protein [Lachnospira sp.]
MIIKNQVLRVGDKIELKIIKTRSGLTPAEERVYVSQILDMHKEKITAAMPIYEGHIIPLEVGSVLETYFYTAKGIFKTECIIQTRGREENVHIMVLSLLDDISKYQRREYYRLPCNIEVEVTPMHVTEVISYSKEHVMPQEMMNEMIKGMIIDLSGGGIKIVTKIEFRKNDYLAVKFFINLDSGLKEIKLIGRVVASIQSPNDRHYYYNRVQFKEISMEIRDSIVKYIFEQQRKIQQKERGWGYGEENIDN